MSFRHCSLYFVGTKQLPVHVVSKYSTFFVFLFFYFGSKELFS